MRKLKNILALILCAMLMLSASAFAESNELKIENLKINMDETTEIDLSGVELTLGYGSNETGSGVHLNLSTAGETAAEFVAALDSEKLMMSLTGLSDIYSLSFADIAKLVETEVDMPGLESESSTGFSFTDADKEAVTAIITKLMEILPASLSENGQKNIDGVDYQVYELAVSEEKMNEVIDMVMAALDNHPELLKGSEYASFAEYKQAMNPSLSINGEIYTADTAFSADVYLNAASSESDEVSVLNVYADGTTTADETSGTEERVVNLIVADASEEEAEDLLYVNAKIGSLNDEFGYVEINAADDDDEDVYFTAYAPEFMNDNNWNVSFGSTNEATEVTFSWSNPEDTEKRFSAYIAEAGNEFTFDYKGTDGIGKATAAIMEQGTQINISADVESTVGDASWIPQNVTETVDVLTMSSEQNTKAMTEASSALMNVLYQLANANETIGAMVSSMMQG